ncbi:MAG: hypothetical protein JW938_02035 [Candidatus Omnitrophica bacterium]|nr:hypothetical protein [Candidatus Omnitrophota bacterium]
MIKHLNNEQGFLLLVFIVAVVIASLAMTTALLDVTVVEGARKEAWTMEKMMAAREGLGERFAQTSNECGVDMCFINEEKSFPTNFDDFVSNGYFKNLGLTSAGYPAKVDAWGDDLIMDSSGGNYRVRSTNLAQNLSVVEALYTAVDIVIEIKDLTDSSGTGDDLLDNTYIDTTASGLYDMDGSLVQLFTYSAPDEEFWLADVAVGCYELHITERNDVNGTWMQDLLGAGIVTIRSVIIIHPMDNSADFTTSKTIIFPWDINT